ncbi:MAG: extracellular solute-binding protein [Bacillota bacterium]
MKFKKALPALMFAIIAAAVTTGNISIAESAEQPYDLKLTRKYKGQTLTIWQGWEDKEQGETANRKGTPESRKEFENATGVKVNVVVLTGESADQKKKTITAITTGNGPDLVWFGPDEKPAWILKKLIVPISKYINFKDKAFLAACDIPAPTLEYFTWKGQVYGVNGPEFCDRLYYNKSLFEAYGLEDPCKLYKEGKWTWDKFLELAKALTMDTDGNGKIDQWGYQSWLSDQWFTANGVQFVKKIKNKYVFGMEDEKAYYTLQYMYDIVFKHKITPRVWWDPSPQVQFYKGKVAMDYWGYWEMEEMKKQMGNKLGIVPFPAGPGLKGRKSADRYQLNGMGITTCCKNPELASMYIRWMRVPSPAERAEFEKNMIKLYGSKEVWDLVQEMNKNSVVPNYYGWGRLGQFIDTIRWIENQTPAQAVQSIKKMAQSEIDSVLALN